jgi:DNA-binding response OmpR family regulator
MHDVSNAPSLLIVDDDELICKMLHIAMTQYGFQVATVSDGEQAVDLLSENTTSFDIVLCDYNLPGINGLQTFHQVRRIASQIRFCLMSGGFPFKQPNSLMEAGVDAVFAKPFLSLRQLGDQLHGLLND